MAVLLLFQQTGYSEKPEGIISLDLCTDWMLLRYADRSQVLAYSPLLYRYQADWVPDGLPVHDGSLEHILQLEPDLLISGQFNAILLRKRLLQLGKTVKVLPLPDSLATIQNYQRDFLSIIQAQPKNDMAESEAEFPRKQKTLLLLGSNGIGTGQDTLENDLLVKAGWDNYIQHSGYVNLELEKIVADPPDAIYWSAPASNSLANLFAGHPAIRSITNDSRLSSDEHWRWQCPGPWSLDLIKVLAAWKNT
ncbi:MAG: iron complex transport system substrate-binding protein [Gammaproteobacteria bacterium]